MLNSSANEVVAAVETEALEKRYPRADALRGVSLRVARGEIVALLGPNGAGKTTWISVVCGLVRATSGVARVEGHDVVRDPMAARRVVGLVPQEVNFDPFFSGREALRFQMGYFGHRVDEARIAEVLEAMGLGDKADVGARELSGGMRRRLLIAKALVHRPSVLFLDEPTAGVDVALRRELWAYVRRLREQGTTIVLTTHYLEEAEALADRVAVIDHGSLVTLDTPERLIARHGRKRLRVIYAAPPSPAMLPEAVAALGACLDGATLDVPLPAHADLAPLMEKLAALGPIIDLSSEQPTLEQVFLELTGKR